jgi:transcriptional regulator with XRE-family HTH domain
MARKLVNGRTTLGQRIRFHRERLGLTQMQLGIRMGSSQTYVWWLEQDRSVPTARTIRRIAKGLGVEVADLVSSL